MRDTLMMKLNIKGVSLIFAINKWLKNYFLFIFLRAFLSLKFSWSIMNEFLNFAVMFSNPCTSGPTLMVLGFATSSTGLAVYESLYLSTFCSAFMVLKPAQVFIK